MKTPVTRPDSIETIRHALAADPFIVAEWYGQAEDDDICEPLIRALEDPHELVRAAAVDALIALDDMYAASPIVGVLAHGSVPARTAAAEVLGEIGRGDQIAIHHLANALSDPDSGVRSAVARSLAKVSR
jgi:HEAT repeat protein